MMKLVDGPAKGTYMCKRAPLYLRAVVNDKGGTDALDMPSDTPTDGYRNACGLDAALEGRE